MKTSMTLFGCGPKLALLCLPYIILSLIVMFRYPEFFNLGFLDLAIIKYLGFKLSIHGETNVFRRIFNEEYDIYERSVNEIFPFPRYIFRQIDNN